MEGESIEHTSLKILEENLNLHFIKGLISGDQAIYKDVFDKYYKSLVITSYQILKDENVSKDAVQEVFLELWKNRLKLHDKISLAPYLKRSVINRSLNILKSRKHHMSSGEEPLSFIKTKTLQPDELYQNKEFKNIVMAAVDSMPDRCRAIFMLCRMQGLSHKEIAKKLDISTKTIENQMTKGLKIIRNAIMKYEGEVISLAIFFMARWGIYSFDLLMNYHLLQ